MSLVTSGAIGGAAAAGALLGTGAGDTAAIAADAAAGAGALPLVYTASMIFISSSISTASVSATPTLYPTSVNSTLQPLANNASDFDRTVLNCTGVLPEMVFPPSLNRFDFLDLPEYCSLGCSCQGNSSVPTCGTGPYSQTFFSTLEAYASCGVNSSNPATQNSSCSCVSPQNASQPDSGIANVYSLEAPFVNGSSPFNLTASFAQRDVAVENRTAPCNMPYPHNVGAADFYNYILAVQINCLPPSLEIWTAKETIDNTSLPYYKVCEPCLFGYGPDPDCFLQPVPLRGVCNDDGSVYKIANTPDLGYRANLYLRNESYYGQVIVTNDSFVVNNGSSETVVPLYSLPSGVAAI